VDLPARASTPSKGGSSGGKGTAGRALGTPPLARDKSEKNDHMSGSLAPCHLPGKAGGLTYKPITPPHGRTGGAPTNTPLSPLFITVRSRDDPFLAAASLSNSTLDFGRTQEEEASAAKFTAGIGLLLFLPPLVAMVTAFLPAVAACISDMRELQSGVHAVPTTDEPGGSAQGGGVVLRRHVAGATEDEML